MEDDKKLNCYNCIHRREVPGSAHSSCTLLSGDNPFSILSLTKLIMDNDNSDSSMVEILKEGKTNRSLLSISKHGYDKGWANVPINFDPIWVDCAYVTTEKGKLPKIEALEKE